LSDDSADVELLKLQRAADFMRGVRLTQAGNDKFIGRNWLSPEQQQDITKAISGSELVKALKQAAEVDLPVNHLAERFEEMARRQGVTMDAELRPSVVKLLAGELWANHSALGMPAEKLISATLHQGAIAPELLLEFPGYPRNVIGLAMTRAPAKPRELLQRAERQAAAAMQEPEFAKIAEHQPARFIDAAMRQPDDMRSHLRKVAEKDWRWHWTRRETERQTEQGPEQPPR
jgi:hypothetical protein